MWPFNIFAIRRAREEQQRRAEHEAAMQKMKDSLKAAERRREMSRDAMARASAYRAAAAVRQPDGISGTTAIAPRASSSSTYDDPLSPLNPLSPLHPIHQASSWSAPVDEPRHDVPCSSASSHSHDYGGSSHSHSSHDHGCSSSSYDSSSSSSYDSGSSSSSSVD
jgi:hypothetical protein